MCCRYLMCQRGRGEFSPSPNKRPARSLRAGYNVLMSEKRFVVPEVVATHFHVRPGDFVGDFGAGSGNFTSVLARLVGPQGKVYACEIQKNLVDKLAQKVLQEHLGNVEVVWGDFEETEGSTLGAGTLDLALMVNTLFQLERRDVAIDEVMRTLRPGGKFFLIDWSESWGGLGPQPGQVIPLAEARAVAESQGLTFEREFDAGDHHYGLAFRK